MTRRSRRGGWKAAMRAGDGAQAKPVEAKRERRRPLRPRQGRVRLWNVRLWRRCAAQRKALTLSVVELHVSRRLHATGASSLSLSLRAAAAAADRPLDGCCWTHEELGRGRWTWRRRLRASPETACAALDGPPSCTPHTAHTPPTTPLLLLQAPHLIAAPAHGDGRRLCAAHSASGGEVWSSRWCCDDVGVVWGWGVWPAVRPFARCPPCG